MNLQTHIPFESQRHHLISYESKLLLIGSCFAENIGDKLDYFKFQNSVNPIGILFNPVAIENFITNAINNKQYTDSDIFPLNDKWHTFDGHSRLSNSSQEAILNDLNAAVRSSHEYLSRSTHIIITLGTAWVYRHIASDKIVANCHKVPQKEFSKELLAVENIVESIEAIVALIRELNSNASLLFTVSPVRHLKDGFIENNQSKAHLLSAVLEVIEPRKNIHYFPAFDIMMDELRDYRFYAEDMVHPNQIAIDYIWEKFKYVWISTDAHATMNSIESIQKGLRHKPFDADSEQHQKFRASQLKKMEILQKEFPFMKF